MIRIRILIKDLVKMRVRVKGRVIIRRNKKKIVL